MVRGGRLAASTSHQDWQGVVATFIIDWPVLAFFGFFFGGAAPDKNSWRSRAFWAGLMTSSAFTASAMLSYQYAPDWMWMYYRDPEELEGYVKVMPAAYLATFLATFAAALGMRRKGVRKAAALSLVAEAAVVGATWDRYHRVGTKQQWEEGTAAELFAAKPEGLAKKISSFGPLVIGSFLLGLLMIRGSGASSSRR